MTDLYDQHIDAMKAREREQDNEFVRFVELSYRGWLHERPRNTDRLTAYKRKRWPSSWAAV